MYCFRFVYLVTELIYNLSSETAILILLYIYLCLLIFLAGPFPWLSTGSVTPVGQSFLPLFNSPVQRGFSTTNSPIATPVYPTTFPYAGQYSVLNII